MAIPIKKYVDIKSGINTARTATEKDLIARFFTDSDLIPVGTVVEMTELSEVSTYFGATSEEYKTAAKYFGYLNKQARNPQKISFYKDNRAGAKSTLAATITPVLTTLQAITSGGMVITGKSPLVCTLSNIDLSGATSLADVATIINDAIRAKASTDWSQATFVLTSDGKFKFTYGISGDIGISVDDTTLSQALGLDEESEPVLTLGEDSHTVTEVFKASCDTSNNFATFAFLSSLTNQEIADLAQYNSVNYPTEFMFVVPVTAANYETIQAAVATYDGVSLELCGTTADTGKYNFVMPMAITATTNYNAENGTVNYMFNQYDEMVVTVDSDLYKTYDSAKINYYGQTQKSGQKLAFYQNGVLQGKYQDQNVFTNEVWLKDALITAFINFMLVRSAWFYNKAGQGYGNAVIQNVIDRAKLNGVITTEKELSENDKNYILNQTSDENAWRQIYQEGYYLTTWLDEKTVNNQKVKYFCYKLLYSKGDMIKAVEGSNILI